MESSSAPRENDTLPCWFCGLRPAERETSVPVPLKKFLDSWNEGGIHKRQFTTRLVWVPRCAFCRRAHDRRTNVAWLASLGAGVIAGIIGYLTMPSSNDRLGTAAMICAIAWAVFGVISYAFSKKLLPEGVKPASRADEYPAVASALAEGYTIGIAS